jgi:hypothetical protein
MKTPKVPLSGVFSSIRVNFRRIAGTADNKFKKKVDERGEGF